MAFSECVALSDALASLALMVLTDGLTHSSKLEIGNFACLTALAHQHINPVSLVTIGIICTLHNFQLYLAHLWTDSHSCFFLSILSTTTLLFICFFLNYSDQHNVNVVFCNYCDKYVFLHHQKSYFPKLFDQKKNLKKKNH